MFHKKIILSFSLKKEVMNLVGIQSLERLFKILTKYHNIDHTILQMNIQLREESKSSI